MEDLIKKEHDDKLKDRIAIQQEELEKCYMEIDKLNFQIMELKELVEYYKNLNE